MGQLEHTWTFLGAMGVLGSCLNLSFSCRGRGGGGPPASDDRITGLELSIVFTPGGQEHRGQQQEVTGGQRGGTRLTLLAVSRLRRLQFWELLMVRSHGRVERLSSHDGRRRQLLLLQHSLAAWRSLLQDKPTEVRHNTPPAGAFDAPQQISVRQQVHSSSALVQV